MVAIQMRACGPARRRRIWLEALVLHASTGPPAPTATSALSASPATRPTRRSIWARRAAARCSRRTASSSELLLVGLDVTGGPDRRRKRRRDARFVVDPDACVTTAVERAARSGALVVDRARAFVVHARAALRLGVAGQHVRAIELERHDLF